MAVAFGGNQASSHKFFDSLVLLSTYEESCYSHTIFSSRTSSSNKVFHKTTLSYSMLSDHAIDEQKLILWTGVGISMAYELVPVMCDMNAAPDALLKIIHCNWKTGCSGNCCSYRTYRLPCSFLCGSCQVVHCVIQVLDELESNDED